MTLQITIRNKSGLTTKRSLNRWRSKVKKAAEKSLVAEGHNLIAAATPLVPIDTGALRKSGFVKGPIRKGQTSTVTAGFGTGRLNPRSKIPTRTYAYDQHENTMYRHPRGGQAKYLIVPFIRLSPGIKKRVRKAIKRAL